MAMLEGRLSDAALRIVRGVGRLFLELGHSSVAELTLPNGRRADIVALSPEGTLTIVEVKSCLADFRADGKWEDYLEFCDRFYFAVDEDFPHKVLPKATGLIVADAYGGAILREGEEATLAPARRKAMTLRFAHHAAFKLAGLLDP
jgi:hypothetical protein